MATISRTNIFSEAFTQLKSIINSNITDPSTNSTNSSRKWIYSFVPRVYSLGFKAFPFIVITPPETDNEQITFKTQQEAELSMDIEIYHLHQDNDTFETLSNSIYALLSNSAHISTLIGVNLEDISIGKSSVEDMGDFNGSRVIVRTIPVTFRASIEEA